MAGGDLGEDRLVLRQQGGGRLRELPAESAAAGVRSHLGRDLPAAGQTAPEEHVSGSVGRLAHPEVVAIAQRPTHARVVTRRDLGQLDRRRRRRSAGKEDFERPDVRAD